MFSERIGKTWKNEPVLFLVFGFLVLVFWFWFFGFVFLVLVFWFWFFGLWFFVFGFCFGSVVTRVFVCWLGFHHLSSFDRRAVLHGSTAIGCNLHVLGGFCGILKVTL